MTLPTADAAAFDAYARRVADPGFADEIVRRTGVDRSTLVERLATSVAEARQTLTVLAGVAVPEDARLLEVGAGLGLTSAFLASQGFRMVALEPGGVGFEENARLSRCIGDLLGTTIEWIDRPAEQLDPQLDGRFDLVFSNNVLEHVTDPTLALRRTVALLSPTGCAIHSCPNYSVPFEPHFGVPLLPARPRLTARALPGRIAESGLWASLNFIRARDVVAVALADGWQLRFRTGALATSLERLATDAEFRSRHGVLARIATTMRPLGLIALVRRLPASWSTPMDFVIGPASAAATIDAVAAAWGAAAGTATSR